MLATKIPVQILITSHDAAGAKGFGFVKRLAVLLPMIAPLIGESHVFEQVQNPEFPSAHAGLENGKPQTFQQIVSDFFRGFHGMTVHAQYRLLDALAFNAFMILVKPLLTSSIVFAERELAK